MRHLLLILWLFVLLFCLFSCVFRRAASAQDASTGAICGTVSDSSGSRIAAANVALVGTDRGLSYSTTTDAEGRFCFQMLPPGEYSARTEFAGMSPQVTPHLQADVGGTLELDFRLSVAGATETVTVTDEPALVDTQPSAVSTMIDERAIQELPLNGRRFTDLALLTPEVTQDPRGLTSATNGDLAFGGIRGYQSSYLVDGADNNNAFFAQARGRYRAPYQFSNEVVQQFRVSSNTYGVELGRAGGAVVNVVTKSGSNRVHGTGFYYLRNSALDAQHPFMDFKPHSQQQQFGFTLGAPIRRNRAFFFAGYDQHIFRIPTIVRFVDGSAKLVPKKAEEPLYHGDYEESDKTLVFGTAEQLSRLAGNYPSRLQGNAAFLKLDFSASPRNQFSVRLSTSRYYGTNNVFFDPASPLTTHAISDNGEENVSTESASLSLTSALAWRLVSHLRTQFSRDLQESRNNSSAVLTRIYGVSDGFGRSTILPRQTREHRLHLAETLSYESGRHSWKFGGDVLQTWIYNFFPSLFGGEYFYDDIKVNPLTLKPAIGGLELTPLRAYAHRVPRYYIQNFGSAVTHPDSNEIAWFIQDTARITNHLAFSLGVRYDLQMFSTSRLVSNPLWADSGKVPHDTDNFAPRVGLAYSWGNNRPLVIRAGYGWFYTRIPQIYTSTIESDNGLAGTHLFLNNADALDHRIFPQYPHPLANCAVTAPSCEAPINVASHLQREVSAFAPNFRTPRVQQASLSVEREVAHRMAASISYLYVHGHNLIRARDANLPLPVELVYPVYDESGTNFLDTYYKVDSFSTWQFTRTLTCPLPPCINLLERPVPQLGAVNVFESAASSAYQGVTVSVRRRMTRGLYFRLG
ncbi:MAG TPA: carboxypeptidase regulatory-like domain-containing protein, partial [Terriglobales bacterium]